MLNTIEKSEFVHGASVPLFRLLADAGRLKVLALVQHEDFTISELSFLLNESQPQISKKTAALKQAGLLDTQKEGTRVYQRSVWRNSQMKNPILEAAIYEGERMLVEAGVLSQINKVMENREAKTNAFFDSLPNKEMHANNQEWFAALHLFSALLPNRDFAVDVGSGDGELLSVLSPVFEQVLAIEKSPAQMAQCQKRIEQEGLTNVRTCISRFESSDVLHRVDQKGGADVVTAARVIRHVASPSKAIAQMARMIKPGGMLLLADYLPHQDTSIQEGRGDVWMGFEESQLRKMVEDAGLKTLNQTTLASRFFRERHDGHLPMQVLTAQKP